MLLHFFFFFLMLVGCTRIVFFFFIFIDYLLELKRMLRLYFLMKRFTFYVSRTLEYYYV